MGSGPILVRTLNIVVRDSQGAQKVGFNTDTLIERMRLMGVKEVEFPVSGMLYVVATIVEAEKISIWTRLRKHWGRIKSRPTFQADAHGVTFSSEQRKAWLRRKLQKG